MHFYNRLIVLISLFLLSFMIFLQFMATFEYLWITVSHSRQLNSLFFKFKITSIISKNRNILI